MRKEKGDIERETEDYQESTMQHFYYIIIQSVIQAFYIIYIALLYIKSGPPNTVLLYCLVFCNYYSREVFISLDSLLKSTMAG